MVVALPFAGSIIARNDIRAVLSIAVLLVSGSIFSMGFFNAVWQFYIAGAVIGLGESVLLYLAVPTLINRWFKKKVGLFIGMCMAFTGIGGVIFNPLGDYLIQEYGWQVGYRAFGIIAVVMALPFTLFAIRNYPADKGLRPYGDDGMTDINMASQLSGVPATTAFRSLAFYALAGFAGLVGFNTMIYQFMPAFASSLPLAAAVTTIAGTMAAAAMAGQALGKILLGVVADKSLVLGMWAAIACGTSGLLLLWILPTSVALVLIGGFLFGPFYACAVVLVPLMARNIFGLRDYSQIYARISMCSAIMGALGSAAYGYLIDWAGFQVLFIAGLAVLGLIAILGCCALSARQQLEHTDT